jgi:membrane associated rhomboid family serine protease
VLTWLIVQGGGMGLPLARSVCNLGLIPGELTGALPPGVGFPMGENLVCATDPGRQIGHVVTSMFLHGSWMHLLGNMWFLWLFGNNVEDSMSRVRFVAFYLLCGLAAALLQVVINPRSAVPMVGASGAISGVMGAYLVLYPRARVSRWCLGFVFTSVALPSGHAKRWSALQFMGGFVSMAARAAWPSGPHRRIRRRRRPGSGFPRPQLRPAHRSRHGSPSRRLVGRSGTLTGPLSFFTPGPRPAIADTRQEFPRAPRCAGEGCRCQTTGPPDYHEVLQISANAEPPYRVYRLPAQRFIPTTKNKMWNASG